MKITTKTGDKGETGMFGGKRVSKGSDYMEALGTLDELHSFLGFVKFAIPEEKRDEYASVLNRIQNDLYRIMSIVGFEMKAPKSIVEIDESDVEFLEEEMKVYEKEIADLGKFIRTGTSEAAARLNIARSVCRRAERVLVRIDCDGVILKYINRLSDLLFVFGYSLENEIAKM